MPSNLDRSSQARFQLESGLSLVGDAWGDPGDPPALLLHGGGQTRHAWSGTAQALAESGWYAVALDQRGHGESDWDPDGSYDFGSYAHDVREVVEQLGRPTALIGASLGGVASLVAIHAHALEGREILEPDFPAGGPPADALASALVLVDIATRMERPGIERIFEFMKSAPDGFASLDEAADAVAAYSPHRERPKDPTGLAKNLRRGEDGRWRWHWDPRFLEGRLSTFDEGRRESFLDDAARALRIPTLLVRGRMSDVLSEEGARDFLETVPHAQYADITEAGHMVAGDRNDVFTNAVLEFLREVRGDLLAQSPAAGERGSEPTGAAP